MKYILFGCSECEKVFKTKEYLRSHIKRRHSDQLIQSLQSSISSNWNSLMTKSMSTINLSKEISIIEKDQKKLKKELEKRLRDLSDLSQYENNSIYQNMCHSRSNKSIEEAEFQNFLKEISSKPTSPPLEDRNPQDILLAAQALDINPVSDTYYLFVAKQFLDKPLPKHWKIQGKMYKNSISGETVDYHPGIPHYKKIVNGMKLHKEILIEKVKAVLIQRKKILRNKYKKGLKSFFVSEELDFLKKKEEVNAKLEEQIQKLGKITLNMIVKIDKEAAKRLNNSDEYVKSANFIESQALALRDNYLKV